MYICTHTHTHMHRHIHTHEYVYIYIYMYTHTHTHTHIYIYELPKLCYHPGWQLIGYRTCFHTLYDENIYIYIYIYIHTYVNIYTYFVDYFIALYLCCCWFWSHAKFFQCSYRDAHPWNFISMFFFIYSKTKKLYSHVILTSTIQIKLIFALFLLNS